jgi:hypothetical protein
VNKNKDTKGTLKEEKKNETFTIRDFDLGTGFGEKTI